MICRPPRSAIYFLYGLDVEIRPKWTPPSSLSTLGGVLGSMVVTVMVVSGIAMVIAVVVIAVTSTIMVVVTVKRISRIAVLIIVTLDGKPWGFDGQPGRVNFDRISPSSP